MREVSLKTLPNVNIRDPSHDKNLPIMSVTGSINQNEFIKTTEAGLKKIFFSYLSLVNKSPSQLPFHVPRI